jgi:ribokinase
LISIGSINADFLFSVRRGVRPGETLLAGAFLRTSGGKAANRAVQACRLGVPARLFGCVGDDDLAALALAGPVAAGVDVGPVGQAPGPTGTAAILVEESGDKTIVLAANANDAWPSGYKATVAEAIASCPPESVMTCDLEVAPGAPHEAIRAAAGHGLTVVVDPSPADRADPELWPLVDHVTPNANEAAGLTGISVDSVESAAAAGTHLVKAGAGTAYVKLSTGGCVVVEDGADPVVCEAPEVRMIDATGAGDSFAGTLAARLEEGRSPADAARWAVAASTWSVGRRASQESYGTTEELNALAQQVRPRPLR